MYSSKTWIIALTSLTACGGGLSDEEIASVFGAETAVSGDVAAEVATAAANPNPGKDLEVDIDGSGFTIAGDITGKGILWSGTIGVDGTAENTQTDSTFDLDLSYDTVEVIAQDVTLDGDMAQSWSATTDQTGGIHMEYDLVGDLDVSGSIKGSAEIDFSMTIDISQSGYSYTYEGTINGKDVAEMAGSGSGDVM